MIATAQEPATIDAMIDATITPADAARVPWQAVVIGAGPAGSAAAWRLAMRGIRVLLVDRHHLPRAKVCGCCLSARAIRELQALSAACVAGAAPLETVRLAQRGRSAVVPLPAGRVISREALDARLVRHAIAAGCHWLPGTHVTAIDDRGAGASPVSVVIGGGAAAAGAARGIGAEFVVVATGLADHVRIPTAAAPGRADGRWIDPRSRIGIGGVLPAAAGDLPAGELVMAVGRAGYCGIVRLEDGRIDVAAAVDRQALAGGADPAGALIRLLDEAADRTACGLPDAGAIRAAAFGATPPLTRRAGLVAGAARRILRIGDAAGYVEPFTGEGIGWALTSGRILAEAVLAPRGLRPVAEAAALHVAAQRREFAAVHARCRLVARVVRRPTLVAAALAAARSLPGAARRLVPVVVGAGSPGSDR